MRKNVLLTLTGADRIGIVDTVTELLVKYDGNVETSRMARLGGEFAMLMLISVPAEQVALFETGVNELGKQGFHVFTRPTAINGEPRGHGWLPYQVEVHGADHEGIVHQVSHYFTQHGINIESMDTGIVPAPMSGTLFFSMTAVVLVPPGLPAREWQADLEDVADRLNVEIKVSTYKEK